MYLVLHSIRQFTRSITFSTPGRPSNIEAFAHTRVRSAAKTRDRSQSCDVDLRFVGSENGIADMDASDATEHNGTGGFREVDPRRRDVEGVEKLKEDMNHWVIEKRAVTLTSHSKLTALSRTRGGLMRSYRRSL